MPDLRTMERDSIRAFVESCSEHFTGKVLDFGCGRQPYRDIVEAAGGDYYGFDRADFPASCAPEDVGSEDHFGLHRYADAILCTQILQYVPAYEIEGYPPESWWGLLGEFTVLLGGESERRRPGVLVLTYPTNWPEVEEADLHRFTRAGMTRLLVNAGFVIERHERRAEIEWQGETFALGYGVVARAT